MCNIWHELNLYIVLPHFLILEKILIDYGNVKPMLIPFVINLKNIMSILS